MIVNVAKTAGFCFGVDRAVKIVNELLSQGKNVCTLGHIIHNNQVVSELKEKGVKIAESVCDVPEGYTLVIRSHGVSKEILCKLEEKKINYVDATCPFVKKIHNIVSRESANGKIVLIAGNEKHPEVAGIRGYCKSECYVFSCEEELKNIIENNKFLLCKEIITVSQTTFNLNEWIICINLIKNIFTNVKIFDTICNTTQLRQQEAEKISKISDIMLVIGGRHSSNTNKLYDICKKNCDTYFIETVEDVNPNILKNKKCVGITAGASTPDSIIREVKGVMVGNSKVEENVCENFEEMLEESLKKLSTGGVVKGTVVGVTPTEIYVDVGRKQSGIVTKSELTTDPNAKIEDIVKVGDELDLLIMRTNDQEGTIMLSKNRLEAKKGWDVLEKALDDGEVLTGVVRKVVNGGIVLNYKALNVFIPASHVGGARNVPLEDYVNKEVKFKIIEINKSRRRIVGSIRLVSDIERKEQLEKFWSEAEVGKTYVGKVKSITNYGVFVDLGCIDGMIHVSELSWNRVKKPSDVLKVGQEVEVRIKSLDKDKNKVALTYKKEEENPWKIVEEKYPVGTVFESKVVSILPYGAFVEVVPGIDGLIHVSQIADHRIETPKEVLSVGDVVKVKVRELNPENKRVSLTMKDIDK